MLYGQGRIYYVCVVRNFKDRYSATDATIRTTNITATRGVLRYISFVSDSSFHCLTIWQSSHNPPVCVNVSILTAFGERESSIVNADSIEQLYDSTKKNHPFKRKSHVFGEAESPSLEPVLSVLDSKWCLKRLTSLSSIMASDILPPTTGLS